MAVMVLAFLTTTLFEAYGVFTTDTILISDCVLVMLVVLRRCCEVVLWVLVLVRTTSSGCDSQAVLLVGGDRGGLVQIRDRRYRWMLLLGAHLSR